MPDEDDEERVYMIWGQDEFGDQHIVATPDALRAAQHFDRMSATLSNIRFNIGFEELILGGLDALGRSG